MTTQDILRALRSTQIGGAQAAEVLDALSVGFRNYCDHFSLHPDNCTGVHDALDAAAQKADAFAEWDMWSSLQKKDAE